MSGFTITPCPVCLDVTDGVVVSYEPSPDEGKEAEFDWTGELQDVSAIVCEECGTVIAAVAHDGDDDDGGPSSSDFRIDDDEDLE